MHSEILRKVLVFLTLIAFGFLVGWTAKTHFRPPTNRFEPVEGAILDKQTGQICNPNNDPKRGDIPTCLDLYKKY